MDPNELDFGPPPIAERLRAPSPVAALALRIAGVIGPLMVIGGLLTEARFWSVWLTGSRATALIVWKEERIVGYIVVKDAFGQREQSPVVETGYHYTFADRNHQEVEGVFWVQGSSQEWQPQDTIEVMYPASRPADSQPAALRFYQSHDTLWVTAQVAVVAGALVTAVSVIGTVTRRRSGGTPAHIPRALPPT